MKYQDDTIQPKDAEKAGQEKQPYEKPRLGRVTLFADQVLGVCSVPNICPTPNPSLS